MLNPTTQLRGNVLLISPGGHEDNQVIATLMRLTGMGVVQASLLQQLPTPTNPNNFGRDGAVQWNNEPAPALYQWPSGVKPAIIASCGLITSPSVYSGDVIGEHAPLTAYDARGLAAASNIPYIPLGLSKTEIFGAMLHENWSAVCERWVPQFSSDYVVPRYIANTRVQKRIRATLRAALAVTPRR